MRRPFSKWRPTWPLWFSFVFSVIRFPKSAEKATTVPYFTIISAITNFLHQLKKSFSPDCDFFSLGEGCCTQVHVGIRNSYQSNNHRWLQCPGMFMRHLSVLRAESEMVTQKLPRFPHPINKVIHISTRTVKSYSYDTRIAFQTRLSKDNGPASKEPKETHNECKLHFHKFH